MRYQERIYIQNQNSAVRNRSFNNFNMSTDMCVFNSPLYNVSGTTKIDCCVCPSEIIPHDTYSGNPVTLPTTYTGDCTDVTSTMRNTINAAILEYNISGETAITSRIFIEDLTCSKVVKFRDLANLPYESWIVYNLEGNLDGYFISDYTDTQNTIIRTSSNNLGFFGQCCDNAYNNHIVYWNSWLSTGYTGTTNYTLDTPYSSATSCNVAKVPCTTGGTITGATYIISANTQTIPLTFDFTANTQTFIDTNANFRYQIYKYSDSINGFNGIPVYRSEILKYSAFSATNTTTQYIPASGITIDGDYMIKGFYQFSACTDFLNRLGKGIDTINYIYGSEYNIYDKNLDYYFVAVKQAEIPTFINNGSNEEGISNLRQSVFFPEPNIQTFAAPSNIGGFIMTLNGLVLAKDYDYTYSADVITLNGYTAEDDIISFIYTSGGGPNFVSDNIDINSPIVSGVTDGQGSNLVYYNTTNNKYEVYTSLVPSILNDIILMLNGVTLANNIDYYQSTSNPKRIILEGDLAVDDIITIIYFPQNGTVNGLNTNTPIVSWFINDLPQKNNGFFSLEVSTGNTFTNFYYSGYTSYNTTASYYSDSFIASGNVGTTLYYRVKNQKNYETLCGNIVTSIAYSDIIPIVIQSNAINSY